MTKLDGKALAAKIKEQVRQEAATLPRRPGLAVVLVGNDPASRVYVTSKRKDCEECGFFSEEYALSEETTQEELLELVETLNGREDIDGILVQLPLPRHLNEEAVIEAISPKKDVQAAHRPLLEYGGKRGKALSLYRPQELLRLRRMCRTWT